MSGRTEPGPYPANWLGVESPASRGVISDAQTSSARYFQRPDAHHIELDPNATSLSGYTGSLELRRQAGLHWRGGLQMQSHEPGFRGERPGFPAGRRPEECANFRCNTRKTAPETLFRRWELSAEPKTSWNFNGDRLDTSLSLGANLTFLNYWSSRFSYQRTFESMDDRLTRGGPLSKKPERAPAIAEPDHGFQQTVHGLREPPLPVGRCRWGSEQLQSESEHQDQQHLGVVPGAPAQLHQLRGPVRAAMRATRKPPAPSEFVTCSPTWSRPPCPWIPGST